MRILAAAILALAMLTACESPFKKKDAEKAKVKSGEQIKDQSSDVSFKSFLGRLRTAAGTRDRAILQTLLTPDFGYRWDSAPAGETVFDYWDHANIWPELVRVLNTNFAVNGQFMVAPPDFSTAPETFTGYRAGARQINGSWRLAYFVEGKDILP